MQSTGRDQQCVAGSDPDVVGHIEHEALPDRGPEGGSVNLRLHAGHDPGSRFGFQEIPRFCLAELVRADQPASLIVVGMDLDRQPVCAIEQLDQDREPHREAPRNIRPHQVGAVGGHQPIERLPGVRPR